MDQPAQPVKIAQAGGIQHRPRRHEQQALERHVVEDVKQRRREGQSPGRHHAIGAERQRQAKCCKDHADVLDRAVGQGALEVALQHRQQNAQHRRQRPHQDHRRGGPPRHRAKQIEHHPDEPIKGDLGHHAAHQRRDMTGGSRVRQRQPNVQRRDPGFRPGPQQHQRQDHRRHHRRACARPDRVKPVSAIRPGQQPEGQQQGHGAETRHRQIDIARLLGGLGAVIGQHQRPRQQRHHLPAQQKREGIRRQHHQRHRAQKRRVERQHPQGRVFVPPVADRENADHPAAKPEDQQEERRQHIDMQMGPKPGQPHRQHQFGAGAKTEQHHQRNQRQDPAQPTRRRIDKV